MCDVLLTARHRAQLADYPNDSVGGDISFRVGTVRTETQSQRSVELFAWQSHRHEYVRRPSAGGRTGTAGRRGDAFGVERNDNCFAFYAGETERCGIR